MLAALVLFSSTGLVRGQDALPLFVLRGPLPPELARRIEGQTMDLEWQVIRADTEVPPRILRDALTLASAHHARAVVWFEQGEASITLHVCDAPAWRLFSRSIEFSPGHESVAWEEVAVVVRSTLVALSLGVEVGQAITSEQVVIATEPDPAAEAATAAEAAAAAAEAAAQAEAAARAEARVQEGDEETVIDRTDRNRLGLEGALGMVVAGDGVTIPGPYGPFARVGVRFGRFVASVAASYSPRSRRATDGFTLELTRIDTLGSFGLELMRHDRFELTAAAVLGLAIQRRSSTVANSTGFTATPSETTLAFLVGIEARAFVALGRSRDRIGLGFVLGADSLAPRLRFAIEGGPNRFGSQWPVEPRAAVSLVVRSRRGEGIRR